MKLPTNILLKRRRGTDQFGVTFSAQVEERVWRKGIIVPGYDPTKIRMDKYGAFIARNHRGPGVGSPIGGLGWEIDHIIPVAAHRLTNPDAIGNLQPLQWHNNRSKGDDPHPHIRVSAKRK